MGHFETYSTEQRDADLRLLSNMLEYAGMYLERETNMHKFAAQLIHKDRYVYPGFRWISENQTNSAGFTIRNGDGKIEASIAWRIFETEDLGRSIADFLPRYSGHEPGSTWTPEISGTLSLSGKIGYRGALNSFSEIPRIAWFVATAALIWLHGEGVDIQCGEARDDMTDSGKMRGLYGYRNTNYLGEIDQHKTDPESGAQTVTRESLTLVWSRRREIGEEIRDRTTRLRHCDPQNLRPFLASLYPSRKPG